MSNESNADHDTRDHDDPRLAEPTGETGMPGEVIDDPHNQPGDQPVEGDRPSRTDLERDPQT